MAVTAVDWTTEEDLTGFDLVLALLAWGYHRDGHAPGHWHRQVARWRAAGVRLQNPPEVLGWNADKLYLGAFAEKGAPVVPTIFVDEVTEAAMQDAAARFGALAQRP